MPGVYDEDIAAAKEMIRDAGQLVTWRRLLNTQPTHPDKPWKPTGSGAPVDTQVYVAFFPVDRVNARFIQALRGTEVAIAGSQYGLMGAVDFEPSAKDVVLRGTKTLNVKSIDPLAPNGDVILYTIEFE